MQSSHDCAHMPWTVYSSNGYLIYHRYRISTCARVDFCAEREAFVDLSFGKRLYSFRISVSRISCVFQTQPSQFRIQPSSFQRQSRPISEYNRPVSACSRDPASMVMLHTNFGVEQLSVQDLDPTRTRTYWFWVLGIPPQMAPQVPV